MGIQQQVMRLEDCLHKLPRSRLNFANSLIEQWKHKRRLSQSQQLWIDKLIEEANTPKPEPEPTQSVELGSMKPLHDLFMRARGNKIQLPKIKTQLDRGTKVELSLAGTASVNAGKVYVKIAGEWYGKVDESGHLDISRRFQPREDVHQLMREIGENPSKAGRIHGRKFDNCMFCGRGLQTTDSVYYGYGPICAEKWGLEWGIARERKAEKLQAENTAAFNAAVEKYFGKKD